MDNIQLLVFDIDGTLVDTSKQTVEDSAVNAINEARDKGYHILIATGRSFFFIHDDVRNRVNTEYYVTVNGACLNDDKGGIIESYDFDQQSLELLVDYCLENDFALGVKYNDHIGVYGNYDQFVRSYVGYEHPGVKFLIDDNSRESFKNEKPLGSFHFAKKETVAEARELMPNLNFIPGDNDSVEALKINVDKTKTIESVLSKLNLTWDNVIAFGDGNNDIEMLKLAKIGVAMGNSSDNVKQHADYVADTVLNDGIAKAFKELKIL